MPTVLEALKQAMNDADAEVTRLCREEFERSEAAKAKIAEARQRAFESATAWQNEARRLIRKPGAR